MARWIQRTGILVAMVLMLAGCTTPGGGKLTPEQQSQRDYFFTANMLENLGKQKGLGAEYLKGLNEARMKSTQPNLENLEPLSRQAGLDMNEVRKYVEHYRAILEAAAKAEPPLKKDWFSRLTLDAAFYKPLDPYAKDVGL